MMIEVYVNSDIEKAIVVLKKEMGKSGLLRDLRLKAIPKKSSRRKAKNELAGRRRRQIERRRAPGGQNAECHVRPRKKDQQYFAALKKKLDDERQTLDGIGLQDRWKK